MTEETQGKMANLKKALTTKHFIRGLIITLASCGALGYIMQGTAIVGDPKDHSSSAMLEKLQKGRG